MSIFPYIYAMIESFGFEKGSISMYAGVVTAAFTFAEFSSGILWGKLSDRIGRKPVLLTGLAGTGLSMLVFGFATNIYVAIIARALGGLLNGYATHNPALIQILTWCQKYRSLADYGGRIGYRQGASTSVLAAQYAIPAMLTH